MKIRDRIDRIGDNAPHILEYARVKRPEIASMVDRLQENPAIGLLVAVAYAAGRASIIAEVEGTTITEVENDPSWGIP